MHAISFEQISAFTHMDAHDDVLTFSSYRDFMASKWDVDLLRCSLYICVSKSVTYKVETCTHTADYVCTSPGRCCYFFIVGAPICKDCWHCAALKVEHMLDSRSV